jgi:glycerate-2-kinase
MKPFRDFAALTGHGRTDLRADALAIAAQALVAVDPVASLRDLVRLEGEDLVVRGRPWTGLRPPERADSAATETVIPLAGRRVVVLGAGKATIGMAAHLDDLLGERITAGCVVVKHGQGRPMRHIEVIEAAHPVPDEGSLAGGRRLLELARRSGPEDLVIGLVTGGSSALAVCPAEGITMADKVATNRLLLGCGADIVAINNVRKHLSRIKGGRLARACGCAIVNFTVSDVVGDPLDCLTDLLVPDRSTWRDAQDTCDRFRLWNRLPASVSARLRVADPAEETPKDLPGISTWIVADSARMCAAAAEAAARRGYAARVTGLDLEGEAAVAGRWLAAELSAAPAGTALIAGGENTVTFTATPSGSHASIRGQEDLGGPSQEAAASAALALDGSGPACVLCLDSDGTDGPTDAAGGLVDDLSAARAARIGVDLSAALSAHSCYKALATTGDLVVTGSTGTNVNDLKIALRPRA